MDEQTMERIVQLRKEGWSSRRIADLLDKKGCSKTNIEKVTNGIDAKTIINRDNVKKFDDELIISLRSEQKLTLKEIAKIVGCGKTYVSRVAGHIEVKKPNPYRDLVYQDAMAGLKYREIADKHNLTMKQVSHALVGVKKPNSTTPNKKRGHSKSYELIKKSIEERNAKIAERIALGATHQEIAKEFNLSQRTLQKISQNSGVKFKKPETYSRPKYEPNQLRSNKPFLLKHKPVSDEEALMRDRKGRIAAQMTAWNFRVGHRKVSLPKLSILSEDVE